jgi:HEPN domain-containing protein
MVFLKEYEKLYTKAKEDFVAAIYLLDGYNNHKLELNLEIIFFHFQQSAEKLIKSLLDYSGVKFSHIHDIEKLINMLEKNNIYVEYDIKKLIDLTGYAVEGRYSVILDDIEDTDIYIAILKKLSLHVEKTIKNEED